MVQRGMPEPRHLGEFIVATFSCRLATWAVSLALAGAAGAPAQTLKERLSDKGSDEQRVDNCGVPPERRGTTPRPDCPTSPPTPRAAQPLSGK